MNGWADLIYMDHFQAIATRQRPPFNCLKPYLVAPPPLLAQVMRTSREREREREREKEQLFSTSVPPGFITVAERHLGKTCGRLSDSRHGCGICAHLSVSAARNRRKGDERKGKRWIAGGLPVIRECWKGVWASGGVVQSRWMRLLSVVRPAETFLSEIIESLNHVSPLSSEMSPVDSVALGLQVCLQVSPSTGNTLRIWDERIVRDCDRAHTYLSKQLNCSEEHVYVYAHNSRLWNVWTLPVSGESFS